MLRMAFWYLRRRLWERMALELCQGAMGDGRFGAWCRLAAACWWMMPYASAILLAPMQAID